MLFVLEAPIVARTDTTRQRRVKGPIPTFGGRWHPTGCFLYWRRRSSREPIQLAKGELRVRFRLLGEVALSRVLFVLDVPIAARADTTRHRRVKSWVITSEYLSLCTANKLRSSRRRTISYRLPPLFRQGFRPIQCLLLRNIRTA